MVGDCGALGDDVIVIDKLRGGSWAAAVHLIGKAAFNSKEGTHSSASEHLQLMLKVPGSVPSTVSSSEDLVETTRG